MADAPIEARGMTIRDLFAGRRFGIEYYQRDYSWSRKNVTTLLGDLDRRFRYHWNPMHETDDVKAYSPYFLGSVVYYEDGVQTYVVDGQQRIITLHLLLIHLRTLLRDADEDYDVSDLDYLIWHKQGRRPEFRICIDDHDYLLRAFVDGKDADLRRDATLSQKNVLARFRDLDEDFPSSLQGEALEPFVDWLLDRVCVAGVRAPGRDQGWEIFETTNNRGKQLGPTDLLKSHLLSRSVAAREKLNNQWRDMVNLLHKQDPNVPSEFIKDYLLARFAHLDDAEERRQISDEFHEWVRKNPSRLGLERAPSYEAFIRELVRVADSYSKVIYMSRNFTASKAIPSVYYNEHNQLPNHLAAVLAGSRFADTGGRFDQAARLIANYLDLLYVRLSIGMRFSGSSDAQENILRLIGLIRPCQSIDELRSVLSREIALIPDSLSRMATFSYIPGANRAFVRYLLARMTDFAETEIRGRGQFDEYVVSHGPDGNAVRPFDIEHIWADNFEQCRRENGVTKKQFDDMRNRLGSLLLLPRSDNRSFRDKPYLEKLAVYHRHNALAASLHRDFSTNNPNLRRFVKKYGLDKQFRSFPDRFDSEAAVVRQSLYERLCQLIWDPEALGFDPPPADAPGDPGRVLTDSVSAGARLVRQLMEGGHLHPDELLIGKSERPRIRCEARLLSDGRIEVPARGVFPGPDEAATYVVQTRRPRRGSPFWHVERDGSMLSIDDLRKAARLAARA